MLLKLYKVTCLYCCCKRPSARQFQIPSLSVAFCTNAFRKRMITSILPHQLWINYCKVDWNLYLWVVSRTRQGSSPTRFPPSHGTQTVIIMAWYISRHIKSLNSENTIGPDKTQVIVLKNFIPLLSPILTKLFSTCVKENFSHLYGRCLVSVLFSKMLVNAHRRLNIALSASLISSVLGLSPTRWFLNTSKRIIS